MHLGFGQDDCNGNGKNRFKGVCDKNGCVIQHNVFQGYQADFLPCWRLSAPNLSVDATDPGKLSEVEQSCKDGKSVEHPTNKRELQHARKL